MDLSQETLVAVTLGQSEAVLQLKGQSCWGGVVGGEVAEPRMAGEPSL